EGDGGAGATGVAEDDQLRLLNAPLGDREQPAHALLLELSAAEDLDGECFRGSGDLFSPFGEKGGGGEVRRSALQVAGPVLGFGGDASLGDGLGQLGRAE